MIFFEETNEHIKEIMRLNRGIIYLRTGMIILFLNYIYILTNGGNFMLPIFIIFFLYFIEKSIKRSIKYRREKICFLELDRLEFRLNSKSSEKTLWDLDKLKQVVHEELIEDLKNSIGYTKGMYTIDERHLEKYDQSVNQIINSSSSTYHKYLKKSQSQFRRDIKMIFFSMLTFFLSVWIPIIIDYQATNFIVLMQISSVAFMIQRVFAIISNVSNTNENSFCYIVTKRHIEKQKIM